MRHTTPVLEVITADHAQANTRKAGFTRTDFCEKLSFS